MTEEEHSMINLAKQADAAELAFIEANRNIKSVEDEERAKELCHEYLNVLRLIRMKRRRIGG
jgi:hypothetical protein